MRLSGNSYGRVKIVNNSKDLEKFKEGDVLVSFATSPELVPAMKKASAIVTNSGGVTCHVVVVSRELKVPCLIGVRGVTQLVKDNNLVEVDATIGIIKKL